MQSSLVSAFVKHRSGVRIPVAAPLNTSSPVDPGGRRCAGSARGAAEKGLRCTDPVQGASPCATRSDGAARTGTARNAGVMVGLDAKVCLGCHETKPLEDFYKNKGGLAGRQSRCKPCFRLQLVAPANYRQRQGARDAVRRAIKAGRMARPSACSACQTEAYTHGHHDDYGKPLDVRWLCKPCHEEHHRGEKYQKHDTVLRVAS